MITIILIEILFRQLGIGFLGLFFLPFLSAHNRNQVGYLIFAILFDLIFKHFLLSGCFLSFLIINYLLKRYPNKKIRPIGLWIGYLILNFIFYQSTWIILLFKGLGFGLGLILWTKTKFREYKLNR